MPEIDKPLDKPTGHLTTVKWRFPSVHPEGRKFTLVAAFLALATYSLVSVFLGWLMIGLTIWVAAFFREVALDGLHLGQVQGGAAFFGEGEQFIIG